MKTITLKRDMGRYDDVSPFLVQSGGLELQIELPDEAGEFFVVAENGKTKRTIAIPRSGTVTLDKLTAGELKAEIKRYLRGTLIKTYRVEPLLLKEVDGELSAVPEIAYLLNEVDEQRRLLVSEREERKAVEKVTRKQLVGILGYAYNAYCDNALLNAHGLSFVEFAKHLNFAPDTFTEEERKTIEEKKEVW